MGTQEFNEGDLVEAIRGEERVTQRLTDPLEGPWIRALNMSVREAERAGYTVNLIEKAKPKLPTEPGLYLDHQRDVWKLHTNGEWFCETDADWTTREAECAPFTRLRTEAETAIDLLAEIREMYTTDDPTYWANLDRIAAKWATK